MLVVLFQVVIRFIISVKVEAFLLQLFLQYLSDHLLLPRLHHLCIIAPYLSLHDLKETATHFVKGGGGIATTFVPTLLLHSSAFIISLLQQPLVTSTAHDLAHSLLYLFKYLRSQNIHMVSNVLSDHGLNCAPELPNHLLRRNNFLLLIYTIRRKIGRISAHSLLDPLISADPHQVILIRWHIYICIRVFPFACDLQFDIQLYRFLDRFHATDPIVDSLQFMHRGVQLLIFFFVQVK